MQSGWLWVRERYHNIEDIWAKEWGQIANKVKDIYEIKLVESISLWVSLTVF